MFLQAAETCHKAGFPFGMPMSHLSDAVDWTGAVFASFGAHLVDEEGKITVKSDAVRQVIEWYKKLVPFLPPDVFAWDDAGNNKWLVAGKGALIMNPPSAWAVAKRDAPQICEQPRRRTSSRSAGVSTPSAVVVMPRPSAMVTIAWMIARLSWQPSAAAFTNERSILIFEKYVRCR